MADSFRDYLIGARKEAERNLYDVENEIRNLQQMLARAEEQQMMFQYVISDLNHKLNTLVPSDQERYPETRGLLAGNAFAKPNDGLGLFGFARNALAHGYGSDDKRMTIREMVLSVLNVMTDGLDVNQMIDFIQTAFGVEVARTSLSPQLSRMKSDGELELVGDVWRLSASDLVPFNIEGSALQS